jgi:hypothetical protein
LIQICWVFKGLKEKRCPTSKLGKYGTSLATQGNMRPPILRKNRTTLSLSDGSSFSLERKKAMHPCACPAFCLSSAKSNVNRVRASLKMLKIKEDLKNLDVLRKTGPP